MPELESIKEIKPVVELADKTLNDLSPVDKKHWELHLNACIKDTLSVKKEADLFLKGAVLPKLKHPSEIHDWLEKPEMRDELEARSIGELDG